MMLFKNNILIIIMCSVKNKINLQSNMLPRLLGKGLITLHTHAHTHTQMLTHTNVGKKLHICALFWEEGL